MPAVKIKRPWCSRDLRRTFRTGLSKLDVAEEIAERTIKHQPIGLKAAYDRQKYDKPMATRERVGAHTW